MPAKKAYGINPPTATTKWKEGRHERLAVRLAFHEPKAKTQDKKTATPATPPVNLIKTSEKIANFLRDDGVPNYREFVDRHSEGSLKGKDRKLAVKGLVEYLGACAKGGATSAKTSEAKGVKVKVLVLDGKGYKREDDKVVELGREKWVRVELKGGFEDTVKELTPLLEAWVHWGSMVFEELAVVVGDGEVKVWKRL